MHHRSISVILGILALSERAQSNRLRGYRRDDESQVGTINAIDDNITLPFDPDENDTPLERQSKSQVRIVGGTTSSIQPNFVMNLAIGERGFTFGGCGGTLISRCHVLSAAHCVAEGQLSKANALYINAYKPFANNDQIPFHFSAVESITVHPNYDISGLSSTTRDDIAIIGLSSCVDEHPFKEFFLQSIMQLADHRFMINMYEGRSVRLSGFGRKNQDPNETFSDVLQSVEVPYIPYEVCKDRFYGKDLGFDEVCAGRWDGGKDACQGDSGGPMFVQEGDVQTQIGVISWGQGCGRPKKPGVYASVAHHHGFIMDVVCETLNSEEICKDHPSYVPPTPCPSSTPSTAPSSIPSTAPSQSFAPTDSPSAKPSDVPSDMPSLAPSQQSQDLESSRFPEKVVDSSSEATDASSNPPPPKWSSGFLIRPSNSPGLCRGICYEPWSLSMTNPHQVVTLPNQTTQPCFLIDFFLKMQKKDKENNVCFKQALEAQNAGCHCE